MSGIGSGTGEPAAGRVRVRQIESLAELAAAWRLVAEILQQDDTHPRSYAFYARHFPRHPELLLVAHAGAGGVAAAPVAAAGGYAAGETLCGALLAHAEPDYVWIGKLAVAAGHRQRGAGSALLALVERNAAAGGFGRLMLGAAPDAEAFYAGRGYRPEHRRPPTGPPQRVFTRTRLRPSG